MTPFTIGDVARSAGVGIETIRYYEREGIIPAAERSESGYRQFGTEAVERLRFVRHAKRLGFTLREIRDLLDLRVDRPTAAGCDEVRERAEGKLGEVRDRIAALQRMETTLARLIGTCRSRQASEPCPMLAALGTTGDDETNKTGREER